MDFELKFKTSATTGEKVCYCKQMPEVVGYGPNEDIAATEFWKAFDLYCDQIERFENQKAV